MKTNKEVKNFIDNLKVWDEVHYQWYTYEVIEVDWEWFDLKSIENPYETKYINYDDLFDSLMEDEIDFNNNI